MKHIIGISFLALGLLLQSCGGTTNTAPVDTILSKPDTPAVENNGERSAVIVDPNPSDDLDLFKTIYADYPDSTFQKYPTTNWWSSTNGYGGHMWYTYNNTSTYENYAIWTPYLWCSGNYTVEAYIPSTNAETTNAKYTISYAGGSTNKYINQYNYSNAWVGLGTYAFNYGSNGFAKLIDATGETKQTKKVGFDAIRWSLQSKLPSAYITVNSPNGGETWTKDGSCLNVTWSTNGVPDPVDIRLYQNGSPIKYLLTDTNNDGSACISSSYFSDVTPGNNFKIKIENANGDISCDGLYNDYSDSGFTIAAAPTLPNLTVPNGSLSSNPVNPGDVITIYATVTNEGGTTAGSSLLRYTINSSPSFSGSTYLGDSNIPVLGSGSSYNASLANVTVPSNLSGTNYIIFYADYQGQVNESDESNTWWIPITINTKPDLTTSNASLTKTNLSAGESVSGTVKVTNIGTATASSSSLYYYLSTDATWSAGDTYLWYANTPELSAGYESTVTNSFAIPYGTSPGTYYILFAADGAKSINESNENNNATAIQISVSAPDLITQSSSVNPIIVKAGNSISVSTTVKNQGSGSASSSTVGYYLSTDTQLGGDTSIGSDSISSLSSGSTQSVSKSVTVPSSTSAGTYYIIFAADSGNAIGETNENNNTQAVQITVQPAQATYDFYPSNATITSSGAFSTGQTLQFQSRIQNLGSNTASDVGIQALLQETSSGQYYSISVPNPSILTLSGNYDLTKSFAVQIPDDCSLPYVGTYKVAIKLDPNNYFSEGDEGNNIALSSNTITINRYSFCGGGGGGGGGNVVTDYDSDGYVDIEEAFAGTKIKQTDSKPIYDQSYQSYAKKTADAVVKNYGADPVNLRTGAFEFTQTDFVLPGRGYNIDFTRTYNSKMFDRVNRLGNGWSFSYNSYYYEDESTGNVQIYLGGALAFIFTTVDGGQTYTAPAGEFDTLAKEGETLIYKKHNGTKYYYEKPLTSQMGLLSKIVDTNGNTTTLGYTKVRNDVYLLTSITDASGRVVNLTYYDETDDAMWDKIKELTETVNSSAPRTVTYTYENGNLKEVKENRTYQVTEYFYRNFTYDADGKMLTYTDPRGTILYNEYDGTGRVTKQYEHNPDIESEGAKHLVYELSYEGPNANAPDSTHCTLVKNYRDSTNYYSTRYCFNASELKIYEEDGLGNKQRWEYNSNGMATKYTDGNNAITTYEYDSKRRKTKEVLPDITGEHTEIIYTYEDTFNKLTQKQEVSTSATRTTKYSIDPANGNILNIEDPLGNKEYFTYDQYGNVATHTDRNGTVTTNTYHGGGNYLANESVPVTGADGTTQTIIKAYVYDVYGNKTQYTSPESNVYSYEFDTKGNLRKETNPAGDSKLFNYDEEDHRISATDELSHVTTYTYNRDISASLAKTERQGSAENITVRRYYDMAGNLKMETDARTKSTQFIYDSANRLIEKQQPYNTTTYTYDAAGNLIREVNSLGEKTEYVYDARNNLLETKKYKNDTDFVSASKAYNGFKQIIKHTDGNGNDTLFEYDLAGRLTKQTDALGNVIAYTYDKNGNKTGIVAPRAYNNAELKNADGYSIKYVYDGMNKLIKSINADDKATLYFYNKEGKNTKIVDRQNSNGSNGNHIVQFTYDNLGRKVSEKDAYNKTITFEYNKIGNVVTKTDRTNNSWTYTYDDFGRLITEKDPANNETSYSYDPNSNKTSITYPDGKSTTYTYDDRNRLTKITDALGNKTEYTYDAVGNKLTEKNKRGFVTTFEYNKLNQLVKETNAQDTESTYTYDNNGNRLTATVAGKATAFAYDEINRLRQITHPGNKIESFVLDEEGNVTSRTDGNNSTITFTYDKLNRLTKKSLPEGDVTYVYNNWNGVTSIVDESGTTNYVYDLENRPTNEEKTISGLSGKTYTIARTYKDDGKLATLSDAANKVIAYDYNSRGLMSVAKLGTSTLASYSYNSINKPNKITYGNGIETTLTYDELQRTKNILISDANTNALFKHDYTYDENSNRTGLVENTNTSVSYTYDTLDQLTEEAVDGKTSSYLYDAAGNRLSLQTPADATTYSYANASNELTSFTVNDRLVANYIYNGNGSPTEISYTRLGKNIKKANFNWDSQNRLKEAIYSTSEGPTFLPTHPNNVLSFYYDDSGNRVKKITNGISSYYINNGLKVLNELDASGTVEKSIIDAVQQIAEIDKLGKVTYVHQDTLGSAVLLTDEAGKVVQSYKYGGFGTVTDKSGLAETNYLFTGQEYDNKSELYYYNARYYDPAIGRFISRDTVLGKDGDTISANTYAYVKNNPLKYIDPTGMDWITSLNNFFEAANDFNMAVGDALTFGAFSKAFDNAGAAGKRMAEEGVNLETVTNTLVQVTYGAVSTAGGAGCQFASALGQVACGTAINAGGQGMEILNGTQEKFDLSEMVTETLVSAVSSKIKLPVVEKSFGPITSQIVTKYVKGQIKEVSTKTGTKMITHWATDVVRSQAEGYLAEKIDEYIDNK